MTERELVVSVRAEGGGTVRGVFAQGVAVVIGREPTSDLVVSGAAISRRHLTLTLGHEGITATDESANGSVVNGRPLRKDSVTLGRERLKGFVGGYRLSAVVRKVGEGQQGDMRRLVHAQLLERLELFKRPPGELAAPEVREEVGSLLGELVAQPDLQIEAEERSGLVRQLLDEVLGLGAIEALLADKTVSEVMVVGRKHIYVERAGLLELTGQQFTDDDALRAVIERIVTPLGRRIDASSPLVDARLPDGSRVNAVIPPLAVRGPCLTIRKFPKEALALEQLVVLGALSRPMAELLITAVQLRKNILISGGTGSGKTTLLGALSGSIEARERIVTIEDAAELRLLQPHVVALESKPPNLEGRGEYTIRDLLKNALRMRPDRIVIGECRGAEALDMLQAMNTGHEGSLTTTHASSAMQAINRLETLCLMAGVELPLSAIRRQIASAIHVIVQTSRCHDGVRRITAVSEVVGMDADGAVEIRELFAYASESGCHHATGFLPTFLEQVDAGKPLKCERT